MRMLFVLLGLCLSGCGQKGPLYLPETPAVDAAAPVAAETEEKADE